MGIAEFVQACIGVQHVTRDPGSSFGILRARPCALFHDRSKAGVERDGEHMRAKASLEAARDMELVGKQARREDPATTREWADRRCTRERCPVDRLRVTAPDRDRLLPRGGLQGMPDQPGENEDRADSSETSHI